jgi:hypothetical protein
MAVEKGSRWQVVCRHGVGVVRIYTHRNGCVRLAGRLASQLQERTYHGIGGWDSLLIFKESRSVGRV